MIGVIGRSLTVMLFTLADSMSFTVAANLVNLIRSLVSGTVSKISYHCMIFLNLRLYYSLCIKRHTQQRTETLYSKWTALMNWNQESDVESVHFFSAWLSMARVHRLVIYFELTFKSKETSR